MSKTVPFQIIQFIKGRSLNLSKVKLAIVVEGDQKAPFSIGYYIEV